MKIKCPKCETEIRSAKDIEYVENGSVYFKVSLKKNKLSYTQKEIHRYEAGEFICASCGTPLPFASDEDVRKYLIKKSK